MLKNELNFKSIPKEMLAFMSAFFRENSLTTENYFFRMSAVARVPEVMWMKGCGRSLVPLVSCICKVREMLEMSYESYFFIYRFNS